MVKIILTGPPDDPSSDELSEHEKKILRYFRDKKTPQGLGVYANELRALFEDVEDCERALDALSGRNFVERGPGLPNAHDRVTAISLTLDGARHIAKNDLD